MRVIAKSEKTINLSGIDDHTVRNLSLITAGGVVRTQMGDIIIVLHQAADMTRDSKTILSAGQLKNFGCHVRDKSPRITKETPCVITMEGYVIPIAIKKGLPYIRMRPFTDKDWNTLPHITITSPKDWNPTSLDSTISEEWYQKQNQDLELLRQGILTETGDLKPDLEDDEDEEVPSQGYLPVDHEGIKVFLSQLIKEELTESFIICKVNGEQVPIEYVPLLHDEYFSQVKVSCYPVQTQASKQQEQAEQVKDGHYNNRAKSSLDIIPKIMAAVSPNYEKYTQFFFRR